MIINITKCKGVAESGNFLYPIDSIFSFLSYI